MKKAIKIITNILLLVTVGLVSYVIGYDYGYSASMDNYIGASECKPSRKWRQRF